MITNLQYLGIYEDAIDDAISECEDVLKELGFNISEIDTMNERAVRDFRSYGTTGDITNSIIQAYFDETESMILSRYPEAYISTYVNCHDSSIDVEYDGKGEQA